jgi:acetyl-CoA acetyltransferase
MKPGFVLAGGMENMSQVPHIIRGLRSGLKLGQGKMRTGCGKALNDPYAGLLDGDHRRELRREIRHHPRDSRMITPFAANSSRTRPGRRADEGGSRAVEIKSRRA